LPGYSPKLPLSINSSDGFALTKDLTEVAKQNFKMLVLTSPGERIMDSGFGVGMRQFLFLQNTDGAAEALKDKITTQTEKYLPYIMIQEIDIVEDEKFLNTFDVRIKYRISGINFTDELNVQVV